MISKNLRQTVLVVGSSGSIGQAIVEKFEKEGAEVLGWQRSRNFASIKLTKVYEVNLVNEDSIARAASITLSDYPNIDIVVYAAGWLRTAPLAEFDSAIWDEMFAVNVKGLFLLAKHLIQPSCVKVLVPIGSVAAHVGADESFAYTATKGGLRSLTFALAQVLARTTRVVLVSPGWVDGGFTDQVKANTENPREIDILASQVHLLGRMCAPSEVANVVHFVSSDGASFMTGTEVFVDGGFIIKR